MYLLQLHKLLVLPALVVCIENVTLLREGYLLNVLPPSLCWQPASVPHVSEKSVGLVQLLRCRERHNAGGDEVMRPAKSQDSDLEYHRMTTTTLLHI